MMPMNRDDQRLAAALAALRAQGDPTTAPLAEIVEKLQRFWRDADSNIEHGYDSIDDVQKLSGNPAALHPDMIAGWIEEQRFAWNAVRTTLAAARKDTVLYLERLVREAGSPEPSR